MAAGATADSVRALLDVESLEVIGDISPDDGMYKYGPTLYAEAGQTGLRMTRLAMLAAGTPNADKVLDFACGAGRVLRYLKAGFPDAAITACDVTPGDVEFCARTFGVNGIVSDPDPAKIELDGPFDVIWCGSLLTHVDANLWVQFLKVMANNLAPGGVMVFTVYGSFVTDMLRTGQNLLSLTTEQAERAVRAYETSGFGFGAVEGRPEEGFGDCIASPTWVTTKLGEATPEPRSRALHRARLDRAGRHRLHEVTRPVAPGASRNSVRELLDVEALEVIGDVSPRDGMHTYAPTLYAEAGQTGLRMIRLAMLVASVPRAGKLLDFASGAGRVLRYLKAGFPQAAITACDVRPQDIDFCVKTFGVNGIVSNREPEKIELDGPYDVIWCGSLLTHVNADLWVRFVQLMAGQLAPGGVMVFTVYGRFVSNMVRSGENLLSLTADAAARAAHDFDTKGFGYGAVEGAPADGYGDCLASPPWVTTKLREATPELDLVLYTERAWIGQDVIACTKR